MAISTVKVVRLTFTTEGGKTFAIIVPIPKAVVTKAEAEAVMDTVIASDILITSSGALTGKRDIKVIDTSTDDLYDSPQV